MKRKCIINKFQIVVNERRKKQTSKIIPTFLMFQLGCQLVTKKIFIKPRHNPEFSTRQYKFKIVLRCGGIKESWRSWEQDRTGRQKQVCMLRGRRDTAGDGGGRAVEGKRDCSTFRRIMFGGCTHECEDVRLPNGTMRGRRKKIVYWLPRNGLFLFALDRSNHHWLSSLRLPFALCAGTEQPFDRLITS